MITRFAMFSGTVKPGQTQAMRAFVIAELAPLWRNFTGALDVQILFAQKQDPTGPVIPLVLSITYPDADAITLAMASKARMVSRDMLPAFYEQFFENVTLWHYEMTTDAALPE